MSRQKSCARLITHVWLPEHPPTSLDSTVNYTDSRGVFPTAAYIIPPIPPTCRHSASLSPPTPPGFEDYMIVSHDEPPQFPLTRLSDSDHTKKHTHDEWKPSGLLDRNLDSLSPDWARFLAALWLVQQTTQNFAAGLINPFVKGLFSGKGIATNAYPNNEVIIATAAPCRAALSTSSSTIRVDPAVRIAVTTAR
ncbi:hypothetical protein OG21DRAFT_1603325 [Imleria badia]|nr:hypothetical protein OG21DRAFT_1603325 [Imleria badia]